MKDILVVVITAYLAFMTGGHHIKDEATKYVDDKCNTEHIIETYNGHLYECKPIDNKFIKQMNKE